MGFLAKAPFIALLARMHLWIALLVFGGADRGNQGGQSRWPIKVASTAVPASSSNPWVFGSSLTGGRESAWPACFSPAGGRASDGALIRH